jgi:GNAT superfamily N-acetyltransferase
MGPSFNPVTVELAADATWPAEISIPLGPWQLRATHGYSHRANSVRTASLPAESNWLDLIARIEDFYRAHNLPPTFHISPATVPPDLDQILAARGYITEVSSQVWSADPAQVEAATSHRAIAGQLIVTETPDAAWLQCALDERIGPLKIREQICRRIPAPRVFATIVEQDQPVARALSVVHSNIAWLYCMATVPAHQRRGFATQLIHSLATWAIPHSAQAMYLQVLANNSAAHALYTSAKFTHQYNYHYRIHR